VLASGLEQRRTKVAVLGGGMGAITTAYELSAPHLQGRYEVTVYQPGWRLGGKCASGRAGHDSRIEEHGLHVWFGFYANAFRMIQCCYDEWKPPESYPIRTWQDAFKKCNDIVLFESWRGRWTPWHMYLPPNDETPGRDHDVTPSAFFECLFDWLLFEFQLMRRETAVAGAASATRGRVGRDGPAEMPTDLGHRLEHAAVSKLLRQLARATSAYANAAAGHGAARRQAQRVEALLAELKHFLFKVVLGPWIDHDHVRRFAIMLDLTITVTAGVIADDVLADGFGKLNREDLWAWLRRHGAERLTLEHAAVIKALYDLVFAYRDGDKRRPDLAAGKALQAMIRIVCEYKGAILWKMQAGMGDTVFTPLYDVLRRRGVRFRFFHRVTNLGVSDDGRSIATIEVQPQVRLRNRHYDPIVMVDGLRCWPSEPRWSQLEDGEELQQQAVNFESSGNPLGLAPATLQAGEDFDEIVLGISVGELHGICGELATANARFKRMLDNSDTVMTEGIQLWLSQTATHCGWRFEPAIATSYADRADTYSNMSQLLCRERWNGPEQPRDVVYLCGVIDHAGVLTQDDADARVRANAVGFLNRNAKPLWPDLVDANGKFDWSGLFDRSGAQGETRLDAQFLRANFQPTERYVMTRAGSVRHRLGADQSGFENLKLAGDWTRNGIDGGSVEAAVTSGMQASRAISGSPRVIQGEHGWLVD
jgi:uncharacterized protein with NAD-binding domain and iron-sulfur cluster